MNQRTYEKIELIVFIIICSITDLKAQDTLFVINGHLEKIRTGTIFLNIYEEGKTIKDSEGIIVAKNVFDDKLMASLTELIK